MAGRSGANAKRITAGLLGFLLLAVLLCSAFALAAEAEHLCTGEDCRICALMEGCADNLRRLSGAIPAAMSVPAVLSPLLAAALLPAAAVFAKTPISQKVRLNR